MGKGNRWTHLDMNKAWNGVGEGRWKQWHKCILDINKEKLVRWEVYKTYIQGEKSDQLWKKGCGWGSIWSHCMSKDTFILSLLDGFEDHNKLLGWKIVSSRTWWAYCTALLATGVFDVWKESILISLPIYVKAEKYELVWFSFSLEKTDFSSCKLLESSA